MKKWRCTICGYVFDPDKGDPEHGIPAGTSFEQLPANWVCPVCGVGTEMFEPVEDVPEGTDTESPVTAGKESLSRDIVGMNDPQKMQSALFKISYGLFVVSSIKGDKINGQCANTVFQITSDPMRVAIGINKNNLTHEFMTDSGVVGITVLGEDGHSFVRRFGYSSGRDKDKFEDIEYIKGSTGVPIVAGGIAFIEGRILKDKSVDLGTHTLFVADVTDGTVIAEREPMTYAYFRKTK